MPLNFIAQEDFAAGILRSSARDSEPGVGLTTVINGLFDDDGDVYRRGGDALFSNPASVADDSITFLWSGFINDVAKTLVTTDSTAYSLNDAGVLTSIGATSAIPRPVQPAVVGDRVWLPGGVVWDGGAALSTWPKPAALDSPVAHVAAVADRLVAASGNKIAFTASVSAIDENTGTPIPFPTWDPTDVHALPDGVLVQGLMAIRDTCLVFSSFGVWAIGNMSFNLTDADGNVQQTLSRQIPELALLHEAGIAEWAGKLVVPANDRVFLLDTISAPIPISDSISRLYMQQVELGNKPGGAKVYRNHYFLPFLDPDLDYAVTTMLVCRLNRPVRGRQIYYPWSIFEGHAAQSRCLDVRLIEQRPKLVAGGMDGLVANLADVFNPGVNPSDVGHAHRFKIEQRDLITGNGQPNHVRNMRVWYTLTGLADGAKLEAGYSNGVRTQTYQSVWKPPAGGGAEASYGQVQAAFQSYEELLRGGLNSAATSADEPLRFWYWAGQVLTDNDGTNPSRFNFEQALRTRYIRGFVRLDAPCEKLTIHKIDFGVRPATHQR